MLRNELEVKISKSNSSAGTNQVYFLRVSVQPFDCSFYLCLDPVQTKLSYNPDLHLPHTSHSISIPTTGSNASVELARAIISGSKQPPGNLTGP